MTETTTRTDDETRTNDRQRWTALVCYWSALDRGWKAALLGLVLVAVQFTPVIPL